jgi:hypothetical protein
MTVTDSKGRVLKLRKLDALTKFKVIKAMGAVDANNPPALGMGMLAASVAEVDGIPQVIPGNPKAFESAIALLGDEGIEAAGKGLSEMMPQSADEVVDAAKN